MRVIIAGSRSITNYRVVLSAILASEFEITEVVSGTARGVDTLGERWARENDVPVKRFPAEWEKYGRGAGMQRNLEMAMYAEGLVAVWDGRSKGTEDMVDKMKGRGKPTYIHTEPK